MQKDIELFTPVYMRFTALLKLTLLTKKPREVEESRETRPMIIEISEQADKINCIWPAV